MFHCGELRLKINGKTERGETERGEGEKGRNGEGVKGRNGETVKQSSGNMYVVHQLPIVNSLLPLANFSS